MNKVFDIDGEQVSSILNFNDFDFVQPFVIVDKLREKELPPQINISTNINKLKEIDFTLYSKNLTKKKIWIKGQRFVVYIRPTEEIPEKGFKKITKLPPNHYFEIDTANHKVRIVGLFSHPSGYGDWIYY